MYIRIAKYLCTSGLVIVLGWTGALDSAFAQDADGKPEAKPAEDTIVLAPITITARRREERAQDAPVAVTVIPSDDIAKGKVDNLEDAAGRSPNVLFNAQGGPLTIRGIGSLGISAGVDRQPSVGVFVDDVFIARPFGYPVLLDDTDRIEIVRGSQATLYGKNTIGGAVNLISRGPGDGPSVELGSTLSTGAGGRIKAAFDTPLGDSGFSTRAVASWTGQEGYIKNIATNEDVSDVDSFATRIVTTGQIGDGTDIKVIADYSRNRNDGGLWYAPVSLAFDDKVNHDFNPDYKLDIGGLSVRLDHSFETFKLTSITAVRGHEMTSYLDGDFTDTPYFGQAQTERQRQFSQDLRFTSSNDGPLRWTGGLFYMHEAFNAAQFFDLVSYPRSLWSNDTSKQSTDTYSAFGEVGYYITPEIELVGGARYTYETKDTTSEITSPSGSMMFGTPGRAAGDVSFQNISPEVSINYHISEGTVVYGKIGRGFKSGGISPYIEDDGSANRYDPELTTTYEVGAKTTFWNGRVTASASVFYTDWTDQQAVIYTTPFTRVIRNAAQATTKGFELEAAVKVTESLTASVGYGYTDAVYEDFVDTVLGNDYSGNPLPYAPKHSANAGMRWSSEIASDTTLTAGVDCIYRSSYSFTSDNLYRQSDTHLVDANIGLKQGSWSATLWAKNLLDERYLTQYFDYSGTDMGVAAPGRTVGLTVAAKW